jgi:hypothetical protein
VILAKPKLNRGGNASIFMLLGERNNEIDAERLVFERWWV